MNLNLKEIEFSYYGSYIGLNEEGGKVYVNSLRGKSKGNKHSLKFDFLNEEDYKVEAIFNEVKIFNDTSTVKVCFIDEQTIILKVNSQNFCIDTMPKYNFEYNYLLGSNTDKSVMVNSYKNLTKYLIKTIDSDMELVQKLNYASTGQNSEAKNTSNITFKSNKEFYILIREVATNGSKIDSKNLKSYDEYKSLSLQKFNKFTNNLNDLKKDSEDAINMAAYILWSSTVAPQGLLTEYATYASNGDFPSIYSWDNCIIAFGMSVLDPKLALSQMSIFTDVQDEFGQIPGSVSDSTIRWNFSKPPIVGWTLAKLMDNIQIADKDLEKMYYSIKKLINYYFNFKDSNGDGICEYHHGNDSGQDNGTAFKYQTAIDAPDLQAYLIEGYVALEKINKKLKLENIDYGKKIKELIDQFVEYYWDGNQINVKETFSTKNIDTKGVLKFIPLILGNKLPEKVKDYLINELKSSKYLTDYGIATEATNSKEYVSDAYWRGPIWAPTTIIFYEAFKDVGESEVALDIAQKYCQMVEKDMTFSENFDALKGIGLRDSYFGWTAGAYLYLKKELVTKR